MAEPRPFRLPISYGHTDAVKDSGGYLINLEAEAAPVDARTDVRIKGSAGLAEFCAIDNFPVVAGLVVNDACYIATKVGIYRIFPDGGAFKLGTISIGRDGMASTNGLAFVVVDGLRTWSYTFRADEQSKYDTNAPFVDYAVELTTAPNYYPSNTVAFINSRFVFDRAGTGQFFNTDALSLTVGAANFNTAESSPDDVTAVFVNHQILAVFGRATTEFDYDTGTGDAPYERVPGGTTEYGIGGPYCVAKVDNTTFVLTNTGQVVAYQAYVPQQVSTPAITDEIKLHNISASTCIAYKDGTHLYFQVNLEPNGTDVPGISLVYDLSTNLWHARQDSDYGRHRASCYMYAFGKHLVGDFASGSVYELSTDVYDNTGAPLIAQIITGPIVTATRLAKHSCFELEVDVGFGNEYAVNPQIGLEISDDDGKTFGNQRLRPLGAIGNFNQRVRWWKLGAGRNRRYRITLSDPVKRDFTSQAWISVS
jgi:hypothetical protein